MSRRWFYRRCGRVHGPLSLEDMRTAAFLGFIRPTDLVRHGLAAQWTEAGAIPLLVTEFLRRSTGTPSAPRATDEERPPG